MKVGVDSKKSVQKIFVSLFAAQARSKPTLGNSAVSLASVAAF